MADTPTPTPAEGKKNTANTGTTINLNKTTTYIIIGLFSLLVTVIIAGTFLIVSFKSGPTRVVETKTVVVDHGSSEEVGILVPLGNEVIVNLTSEDGMDHYLKVNATLELEGKEEDEEAKKEVVKRIPLIRDLMISILSTKTKEKIEEKEGKEQIRSEIISSINKHLGKTKVKNLYFEDFLIN